MSGRGDPGRAEHAPLRAFARAALGGHLRLQDRSRSVGRLSVVWRATTPDGTACYVKQAESAKLYRRERDAYLRWVPRLAGVAGTHLPELLAHDDELGALALTALPAAVRVCELAYDDPRRLEEGEERQLALYVLLHALATIPWAAERGDLAFEALARRTVARLRTSLR